MEKTFDIETSEIFFLKTPYAAIPIVHGDEMDALDNYIYKMCIDDVIPFLDILMNRWMKDCPNPFLAMKNRDWFLRPLRSVVFHLAWGLYSKFCIEDLVRIQWFSEEYIYYTAVDDSDEDMSNWEMRQAACTTTNFIRLINAQGEMFTIATSDGSEQADIRSTEAFEALRALCVIFPDNCVELEEY